MTFLHKFVSVISFPFESSLSLFFRDTTSHRVTRWLRVSGDTRGSDLVLEYSQNDTTSYFSSKTCGSGSCMGHQVPSSFTSLQEVREMASKKSDVWSFFEIDENDDEKTICNLCSLSLLYKGKTTKTMWNHLKSKHSHAMVDMKQTISQKFGLRQPSITSFSVGAQAKFSKEKVEECYRAAAEICAADLRPLGMFNTPAYRRYMSKVQPAYHPPGADTVKKYLRLQYIEAKTAPKEKLMNEVAVALTCDMWTSIATQGYLTATAHFISEDWVLNHSVLGTKRVMGRHTGKHIYQNLASIQMEYQIEGKVAGITSDNASNMRSACSQQKFSTCDAAHIQYFAHTLQLAVGDALNYKPIQDAAAAARKLVGHFNRSSLANDALESYQVRQGEKPLKLIQDVPTRWNSMYFMFERLARLRTAVYYVLHERKYTKPTDCNSLQLSENTWSLIEMMLPALQPLVEATEALASEEYPSVSCIMPMLLNIMRNDLAMKPDDSEVIQVLKRNTTAGLRSRFICPDEEGFHLTVPAISSFLDPRHKALNHISDDIVKENIKLYILDLMKTEEEEKATDIKPPPEKRKKTVLSYMDGDFTEEEKDGPEDELFKYQTEPVLIRNPLDWWKHYSGRFPRLGKLAREFLCIMGTSVPSERVFSVAGLVVTKTRNKLDSEVVDEIIFLNKALHQKYKKGKSSNLLNIKQEKEETPSTSSCNEETLNLPTLLY